jgi:PST family polysaccharide transporter
VIWSFLATAGAKIVTLAGLVVLARLLAPAEFGLLAFAMTYIVYAETIGDLGSGSALIYWPDRREDAAQVTFLINLVAGTSWCIVTYAIAPFVADFFNSPNGTPIVRALAFGFIIKYLGNTHDALSQRELNFRARTLPEIALALVKATISIALAYAGFGAWSLVWGHLAGLAAATIFFWLIVPWRPSLRVPRDLFRPMLHYGRGIIAVNVLSAIIHHADLAIVGRYLGVVALGVYQMATKIPEATITIVVRIVGTVLFPTFARIAAAGAGIEKAYLVASRYMAAVTFPMVAGLYVLAPQIVLVALGPQWTAAAPIVRALAILVGIRAIATPLGDAMKGMGEARRLAQLEAVRAAITLPALFVGTRWGAAGVAAASAVADGLATAIGYGWAARRMGLHLGPSLRVLVPGALSSAVMSGAVLLWLRAAVVDNEVVSLGSAILIGAIVYLTTLRLTDPAILRHARETILVRRVNPAAEGATR